MQTLQSPPFLRDRCYLAGTRASSYSVHCGVAWKMGDKDLEARTKALYHVMQSIEVICLATVHCIQPDRETSIQPGTRLAVLRLDHPGA